jgi:adenylosuccinate lyase
MDRNPAKPDLERDTIELALLRGFGDEVTASFFSKRATLSGWLEFERALAAAQAELGIIPKDAADLIQREVTLDRIDPSTLDASTRIVGYPILPVLRQLSERCSPPVGQYVHWGATTQDVRCLVPRGQMRLRGPRAGNCGLGWRSS